jgi:hypothetical protein
MLAAARETVRSLGYTRFPQAWQSGAAGVPNGTAGARDPAAVRALCGALAWFLKGEPIEVKSWNDGHGSAR